MVAEKGGRTGHTKVRPKFFIFIFYTDYMLDPPTAVPTHVRRHSSPSKPKKHVSCFLPSCALSSTLHQTAKAHPHGHDFGVWHISPPFLSPFTTPPSTFYAPDAKNMTPGSHSSCLGCPSPFPSPSTTQTHPSTLPYTFYTSGCSSPSFTLYHPDTKNATLGLRVLSRSGGRQ